MRSMICPVTTNFASWLVDEMSSRGLTASELAALCGTYPATITNIINENRKPGPEICRAIAKALNYPQAFVFFKAGLMTEATSSDENDLEVEAILRKLMSLPEDQRRVIERFIDFQMQEARKKQDVEAGK